MSAEVRRAEPADMPAAAEVLAAAFASDPPLAWLVPAEKRRIPLLQGYFQAVLPRLHLARGEVWLSDDPPGAAAWIAPGGWPVPFGSQLPTLPALVRVFGRRPLRALSGIAAIERGHPDEPHWYLDYLGVDPRAQGRGTGSRLLAPLLERCDRNGAPAYLNAGSPASRELYSRHGFEVVERFRLPLGGPPLWRMWRVPRTVA